MIGFQLLVVFDSLIVIDFHFESLICFESQIVSKSINDLERLIVSESLISSESLSFKLVIDFESQIVREVG